MRKVCWELNKCLIQINLITTTGINFHGKLREALCITESKSENIFEISIMTCQHRMPAILKLWHYSMWTDAYIISDIHQAGSDK